MTLRQLTDEIRHSLTPHYGEGEARWLVRTMMEWIKGYPMVDLACKANDEVTDWLVGECRRVAERLLNDEPIQYIFSRAQFYGLTLKVTPATLIPRPETAELVDMVVKEFGSRSDLRVLDVCTGSGCIALALSRNLPFSQVEALDISGDALEVARENARQLRANVKFCQADALHLQDEGTRYDIIISNPPYIADHERADMEANVLRFEPHQALFVPDSDPLLFYRAISIFALKALNPLGALYFEINPDYADDLARLMKSQGWGDVEIFPDSSGRRRFLIAKLAGR